ncbi:hypothetical protein S494_23930 [Salmonella enterica subsp. enterica]|nr:hypothetical protein [Salmonella enterica subsp. enterica]
MNVALQLQSVIIRLSLPAFRRGLMYRTHQKNISHLRTNLKKTDNNRQTDLHRKIALPEKNVLSDYRN